MKHTIFCVDLDGTLYDNSHRLHLIPEDKHDTAAWVKFNGACANDIVRQDILTLVKSLIIACRDVRFLTGRGAAARQATLDKLNADGIAWPSLFMRNMTDHRPAWEFKVEIISRWLNANKDAHVVAIEDDPAIVDALRKLPRVTVLHIDSMCCAVTPPEISDHA